MLSKLSLHPRDLLALLSLAAAAFASGVDALGWQAGWLLVMVVSGLCLLHGIGQREQRVVAALAHTRALLDDRQPLAGDALASIERLQAVLHDKVTAVKRMRTLACDLTVATGTLASRAIAD